MDFIYKIIPEEIVSAIGWTIFHSIWQGIIAAILLGTFLLLAGKKSARLRYNISVTALFVMFAASLITFIKVYDKPEVVSSKDIIVVSQMSELNSSDETNFYSVFGKTQFYLPDFIKNYFDAHMNLIVSVWLIGFMVFSLRFIGGLIYVRRLRFVGLRTVDDSWNVRLRDLSSKLNVKHIVQLFESAQVKVPIAIGYLKPMILLPIGMIAGLPYEQVESIIVHELAHIKRYDFVINLFQSFIEVLFFYHPVVWFISASINSERENCCDDIAVNICEDSLAYSKALYNLHQIQSKKSGLALAAIGKTNKLYRRIKRMNTKNYNTAYGIRLAAFALLLAVMAIVSLFSSSSTKNNSQNLASIGFVNPFDGNFLSFNQQSNVPSSTPDTNSIKKGLRTLKFHDEQNGDEKRFKAKLNDGKLESLYIDGEKVDDKDLPKYENKIAQKADEYDSLMKEYYDNMSNFRHNMKSYSEKLKKFKGNHGSHFDFVFPPCPPMDFNGMAFDSDDFREMMENIREELHDNLAGLRIPQIHIPPINIPRIPIPPIDLDEFCEEFKDYNFDFDTSEFKESMKELKENMKNFKFDMEKFKKEMKESGPGSKAFKENMKELKKNMGKLKEELKPLRGFFKETKKELVKDNLLEPGDDLDSFKLSQEEMFVNGKKVSPELHKKYLELYAKHYGKELKDDCKIEWND